MISFWNKKKELPKKMILGAEKAPVLSPFWVLVVDAKKRRHVERLRATKKQQSRAMPKKAQSQVRSTSLCTRQLLCPCHPSH